MDSPEARELLRLYRPGTTDAMDPRIAEALQQVQRDPELADWFNQQCGVCIALRSKLKQIEIPPDLKRTILLGHLGRRRLISFRRPGPWLALAAALTLLATILWQVLAPQPDNRFSAYRERVTGQALRGYQMTLLSTNSDEVRTFLHDRQWPADYELPKALEKLPVEGCADLEWHGRKYSMVCFDAGKNKDGKLRELYLLVADQAGLTDAPPSTKPVYETLHQVQTASWLKGRQVYVLVGNRELSQDVSLATYLN